jgi:hypothetical protein
MVMERSIYWLIYGYDSSHSGPCTGYCMIVVQFATSW